MGLIEDLKAFGADTDDAIDRLRGNEELYVEIVLDCLEDIEDSPVIEPMDEGDFETACLNAHTMKGIMGNLGITPLYEIYLEVNDLLKDGHNDAAREKMEAGLDLQQQFNELIQNYA